MALEDLEDLLEDIQKQKARCAKAGHLNAKDELKNNVYPFLEAIIESVAELEDVVAEGAGGIDDELIDMVRGTITLAHAALDKVLHEFGGEEKLSDFSKEHVKAFRMASEGLLGTIAEMEGEEEPEEVQAELGEEEEAAEEPEAEPEAAEEKA